MLTMLTILAITTAVVELTPETWDRTVGEKHAFVKFYAPWCGHCKALAPAWQTLAEEFAADPEVLIAEVDCTASGKPLCETHGVQGYPALKTFWHGMPGEDYTGGRDLTSLRRFVEELEAPCSPTTLDACSEEERQRIETWSAWTPEARAERQKEVAANLKASEDGLQELLKSLQAQYEEARAKDKELREFHALERKILAVLQ